MKISPTYRSSDWNSLNLTKQYSENWNQGAEIVKDRIYGRYLKQIDVLENNLDNNIWEFSGFLIMAVDCMVIETLNQFYLGLGDTNEKYERRNWESFRDFFARGEFFKSEFENDAGFDDDKAKIFYDHVRNGLLHQAQTKKRTLIRICENSMLEYVNPENKYDGLIISRDKFHAALVQEFDQYIQNLRTDDSQFEVRRGKCIEKMRKIC